MSGQNQTFVGPTPDTFGLPANQCLLPTFRAKIASVCEPSKLAVRMISSDFNLTPFTGVGGVVPLYGSAAQNNLDPHPVFSGTRTGVTFEGPFLEYTITKTALDMAHADGLDISGMAGDSIPYSFYFDLVGCRTILLPYIGDVHVISQYPGQWVFQHRLLRSPYARVVNSIAGAPRQIPDHAVRHAMPLESDNTLSLRIAADAAGNSYRNFDSVPNGGHSLTVAATTGTATMTVLQESNPGGGGGVGPAGQPIVTNPPVAVAAATGAFMTRIGVLNGQALKVTLAAAESGFAQFHLGFA